MAAEVQVFLSDSDEPLGALMLGEILMPSNMSELGEGEPKQLEARNTGTTALRDVEIRVDGEGRENVQLAAATPDGPGVWASPGEGIIPFLETVFPGQVFTFWARGVYNIEDDEGERPFRLIVRATSIG